jgi:branched-chain amino acid aminotransferase
MARSEDMSKVWMDGTVVDESQACVSVFDHGLLYGDGVFEGLRAYGGRVFRCRAHLRRLFESAKGIRLQIPYEVDRLASAMRETLEANAVADSYLRLVVTRGSGPLGLNPLTCPRPRVFVMCGPVTMGSPEARLDGVDVIVAATMRNHPAALSPKLKTLNYMNSILARMEAMDAGAAEAIMLNHQGLVAEGSVDNVVLVRTNGRTELVSPPSHAGALEGVTLGVVREIAKSLGLHFTRRDLLRHDLYTADELFLTGTAAEILPVRSVDRRPVGAGKPGPITVRIMEAFDRLVREKVPEA